MREIGAVFVDQGFFDEADDIFYLNIHEVHEALSDVGLAWSGGSAGPRNRLLAAAGRAAQGDPRDASAEWTPPAALGSVPEVINDPTVQLLWGVTADRLRAWASRRRRRGRQRLRAPRRESSRASPASCGRRRDRRRCSQGEVLVCSVTAPSWGPVFPKIAAAVSDIGGMMSHAAIVAREYGLPAVVGTGNATSAIKTGDRVRVDGNTGTVTILD